MKSKMIRYINKIVLIENVLLVFSLIASMFLNLFVGMEFFGFIYSIYFVYAQDIFLLFIAIIAALNKNMLINKIAGVFNFILNSYLIYLCLYVSTPDVFSWKDFIFANGRIIKIFG